MYYELPKITVVPNEEKFINPFELTEEEYEQIAPTILEWIIDLAKMPLNENTDKVMKAERYRPAFFEGFEDEENTFENTEQLLNIPWIKSFSNNPNFHRFSIGRDKNPHYTTYFKPQHNLMAEYKDGAEWWVVAFIRDKDISGIDDLPEWDVAEATRKRDLLNKC